MSSAAKRQTNRIFLRIVQRRISPNDFLFRFFLTEWKPAGRSPSSVFAQLGQSARSDASGTVQRSARAKPRDFVLALDRAVQTASSSKSSGTSATASTSFDLFKLATTPRSPRSPAERVCCESKVGAPTPIRVQGSSSVRLRLYQRDQVATAQARRNIHDFQFDEGMAGLFRRGRRELIAGLGGAFFFGRGFELPSV